jgi:hypothetical protein
MDAVEFPREFEPGIGRCDRQLKPHIESPLINFSKQYDMITGPLFRRMESGVPVHWDDVSPQFSIHTPDAAQLFGQYIVK